MSGNDVLVGKDDFLFLNNGAHGETALLRGVVKPSDESLNNFSENIEEREKYCSQRGIDYLHVIFPSKHIVYSEKLPDSFFGENLGIYERFYNNEQSDRILYLKDELIRGKTINRTFRLLDTHMTDYGAYISSNLILKSIGIFEDHEFEFTERRTKALGDLAKMMGIENTVEETVLDPKFRFFQTDNISILPRNRFHSVITRNKFSLIKKRIVIFGDSFFQQCLKFLSEYFSDILFIRSSSFQPDIIEMFQPDIVITSNVERYLRKIESDKEAESFILSQFNSEDYTSNDMHQNAFNAMLSYKFYRNSYEKWVDNIDHLYLDRYTELRIYKDIDRVGGGFLSTGNDPIFMISDVCGREIGKIDVIMESDSESVARIYFIPINDSNFTERNSVGFKLIKGLNNLCFDIGGVTVKALRFDPLMQSGLFNIKSFTIN